VSLHGVHETTAPAPVPFARPAPRSRGQAAPVPATPTPTAHWSDRLRAGLPAETGLAIGVVVIVSLLIVPLPALLLDALLALSLGLSVVVLLVTISTREPTEFSVFPSLLLLLTLLRLGLNVSSTRLILSEGTAGRVIEAFGGFVIGGNFVVGIVIFLILVVINFVVITKGAGRIAEVAARFTLDAMPGKQMAIDADLSAGLIDEVGARQRRAEIARHADFYGAMDGAAKFVRGDAIAGLIITAINLVGGFLVGMLQQGLSAAESMNRYAVLTVGDGLVSQIPSLIVSTAAGMIVTFGTTSTEMGPAVVSQLTRRPRAIWVAAGVLTIFALLPGLPMLPFLLLAATAAGVAWRAGDAATLALAEAAAVPSGRPDAESAPPFRDLLRVEPLEIEVGYALVPLVDEAQRGDLLQRISIIRKQLAVDLGIVIPAIRVRDNIQLPATSYAIKVRGVRVAGGEVMPRYFLALDNTGGNAPIEGIRTTDPAYGLPATWISPERRAEAEVSGYSVVEPATVLATHLLETIRRQAAELLSRQDVRELLDGLKETHPALVEDAIPQRLTLGTLHRVMQRLLREAVPVRDLSTILETLSDASEGTKDPEVLTEHARKTLAPAIAHLHADPDGAMRGITIGPRLEAAFMTLFSPRPGTPPQIGADDLTGLLRTFGDLATAARREGHYRPVITPPALRVGVRRLLEPVHPHVPVLSLAELPAHMPLHSLSTWEIPRAS